MRNIARLVLFIAPLACQKTPAVSAIPGDAEAQIARTDETPPEKEVGSDDWLRDAMSTADEDEAGDEDDRE